MSDGSFTAICFNCGVCYTDYGIAMTDAEATATEERAAQVKAWTSGFCTPWCLEKDNQRLVEGNGIIASALNANPQALSNQNALQLHASGIKLPPKALNFTSLSVEQEHRDSIEEAADAF